ncbi:MAG: hypothetical protein IPK93_00860 [Solirubrobacterales bacterium]|nr:hypothetical protein [Solirubrobacterales bacterium]
MKRVSILMMLLIASMAVVVIGCGSSDSSSSDAPAKDEYIASADKICTDSDTEISAMGSQLDQNATQEDTLALVKSDLIPALQQRAKDLEALPRPAGDEDTLGTYTQSLNDAVSTLANDPESIFGGVNPFEESNKLATEYGLKACSNTGA